MPLMALVADLILDDGTVHLVGLLTPPFIGLFVLLGPAVAFLARRRRSWLGFGLWAIGVALAAGWVATNARVADAAPGGSQSSPQHLWWLLLAGGVALLATLMLFRPLTTGPRES